MLFAQRFWPGITDGSIDLTFRRWKRVQVIAGNRYRTPAGIVQVDQVDVVDPQAITDADARRSGFSNAAELRAQLRGTEDLPVYRIAFQAVHEPDPRDQLAKTATLTDDDVADIDRRLARLDKASSRGAWTTAVLECIEARPATRAPDLAVLFGLETQPFKLDVRKLKNLGLTISLPRGYRLSPRGEAYLARRRGRS